MKMRTPAPRQHFMLDPSGHIYNSGDDHMMEVDDHADVAQLEGLGCVVVAETPVNPPNVPINLSTSQPTVAAEPPVEPHE